MIRMEVEHYPKPGGDWHERIIWLWMEDDARPPGRERGDSAFERISGINPATKHRETLDHFDAGDAVFTVYRGGWVHAGTCEGEWVGVVIKER